jgi:hypothetical protein
MRTLTASGLTELVTIEPAPPTLQSAHLIGRYVKTHSLLRVRLSNSEVPSRRKWDRAVDEM